MTERLEPGTRIARTPGLVVERLGMDTVMLDPEEDRYLRLNENGGKLWEALAEPRTIAELSQDLASQAGIDLERATTDTTAFVRAMLDHGAVTIEGEDG